ncbi:MAG: hypothetical protein JO239_07475 [Paraburkholderia sp.]|nr:hypothetical protein [Paraburkholderia sp.]
MESAAFARPGTPAHAIGDVDRLIETPGVKNRPEQRRIETNKVSNRSVTTLG